MNWLLSQQYRPVILVSGYPVLTAVNLPKYECLLSSYTQVTGSHNSWKCDISHWFPGGADGQGGRQTYIVQSCDYQNFLNA